jgi:hypothetical protein
VTFNDRTHASRVKRRLIALRVVIDYRIIYQLADNDKTVRVATIRHRSIAYGSDPRYRYNYRRAPFEYPLRQQS